MSLTDEARALLREVFHQTAGDVSGINAKRCRADHAPSLDLLDWLEQQKLIKRDHVADKYRLPIAALPLLEDEAANALLADISAVFDHLQACYRNHLEKPIPLQSISEALLLERARLAQCVSYLKEAPLLGGCTTDLTAPDAIVVAHEGILRHSDFPKALTSWQQIAIPRFVVSDTPGNQTPLTDQANEKRWINKRKRLASLEQFLNDMDRLAQERDLSWDRAHIPVTKRDFLSVFKRVYGIEIGERQLTDDIRQFGAKFTPGTKHRKNNILEQLFPRRKSR